MLKNVGNSRYNRRFSSASIPHSVGKCNSNLTDKTAGSDV